MVALLSAAAIEDGYLCGKSGPEWAGGCPFPLALKFDLLAICDPIVR